MTRLHNSLRLRFGRFLIVAGAATAAAAGISGQSTGPDPFEKLAFRTLGPGLTSGRISDIEVDPKNPSVWYAAAASGNLWKTENRGNTWTPIFETYGAYSLGAVVVDPRNSNVVWLGTGENNNQRSVAFGDGIYKSTDAGKTWARMGLENSEHIQNIVIDPRNSDVVYVTAIGPLWSAGGDRGLYKTTDGGKSWKAVLTISGDTGVTDLVMDPKRPDTLYAAAYQRRRAVGQLIGGGPESGLYKSTDGGAKWTKLTRGLPTVEIGRIGLGINWRNPNVLYALVTAQRGQGGFFRSDDGGASWMRIGREVEDGGGRGRGRGGETPAQPPPPCGPIGAATAPPAQPAEPPEGGRGRGRGAQDDCYRGGDPGYYNEVVVDLHDPETIWSPQTTMWRSQDGGKTWREVPLQGVHVDHHDILGDPADKNHYLIANDGGLYETYDNFRTFRHFTNLPLSQFYRINTDNSRPFYKVCGGAQDNGTICGPSRTLNRGGIRTSDWYTVGGGDGFQARVDPEDPNIVYAQSQNGSLNRLDLRTGQSVSIRPNARNTFVPGAPPPPPPPAGGQGGGRGGGGFGRWHWDAPLIVSPHMARRIYYAGEKLYRSDNRGDAWTAISADLTRNLDRAKIEIMGKVWPPDSVAYMQATTTLSTITTIDESPLLEGLLITGSDDGLVHVSEDGGKNWHKIDSFPGVPAGSYVTDVYASPRDVNTIFVTINNYQRGDFKPYVMKSVDRGRAWTSISGNLPPRSGAWSIVQDHVNGNLLFAGLEFGVFFTTDGGKTWMPLRGGIPTTQARDLEIQKRENDLVVGSFGRGAYVLDDYTALRDLTPQAMAGDGTLFQLRDAYQYDELGQVRAAWGDPSTPNPPYGALFTYYLGKAPESMLVINITDDTGKQVRRLPLPNAAGLNRIAWNLRGEPPAQTPAGRGGAGGAAIDPEAAAQLAQAGGGRGGGQGAPVPPGRYRATLARVSGDTVTPLGQMQMFNVVPLPR
jgi:photosystem II stability/assembly factor-like uncharacterized protein